MLMNSIFKKKYYQLLDKEGIKCDLEKDLLEIVEGGFLEKQGCFFLRKLLNDQSLNNFKYFPDNFPDNVSKECFINSVHIDDSQEIKAINFAMYFVRKIFKEWNLKNNGQILKAILSTDVANINIKFHLERDKEFWIDPFQLDNVKHNGVLLVNSNEGNFI